jgi:hypothetical protein
VILADSATSVRVVCHNRAGLAYQLPQAYKTRIASLPRVQAVAAQTWFGGIYQRPTDQFPNVTLDDEAIDVIWPDWGISSDAIRDFRSRRTTCLVGKATMKRSGWRVGQQIVLCGTLYPVEPALTIVGTLGDKGLPDLLVFRRDYLEVLLNGPGRVDRFWVKADRTDAVKVCDGGSR